MRRAGSRMAILAALLAGSLAAGCGGITGRPAAGRSGVAAVPAGSPGGTSRPAGPAQGPADPARAAATSSPATGRPTTVGGPGSGAAEPARPLAGKVVVLDPGHNGANWSHPAIIDRLVNVITEWKACDTVGTETGAGYPEHAFTFDVATRLARLLRAGGATVVLTRHSDTGVGPCITQRAEIGNRAHAAAAISIHADGGPPSGTGFEIIEPGRIPGRGVAIIGPSDRLGRDIRDAYHRITGEPYSDYVGTNGLDVRTDLGGLNLSTVPKVFIECGNMRNAADAARLSSPAFRQRIAVALAAGFTAFLAPGSHP